MITFILAVCGNVDYVYSFPQSPPSRAAWIEMLVAGDVLTVSTGRRLHGRRGLKCLQRWATLKAVCSPPSRAAWIEMLSSSPIKLFKESPPSRAAWIEIMLNVILPIPSPSPPSRAAWIEMENGNSASRFTLSPPSRAAWIEIDLADTKAFMREVAAFTGGVD